MKPRTQLSRREVLASSAAALVLAGCGRVAGKALEPSATTPRSDGDAVDRFAAEQMATYGIPGMSLAVVRNGSIEITRTYGHNDVEFGVVTSPTSVYQLASVSKIFTSVAIGILIDARALTFDSPVAEILRGIPSAWSAIRIRHLLSHTSGLPPGAAANPRYAAEDKSRRDRNRFVGDEKLDYFTATECLSFLAELPLAFTPGERWSYNQPGYMLLGMIVQQLTGRTYPDFMRDRVFGPLGMTTAVFGDSRVVVPGRRQVAYTKQFGPLQNWIWPYSTWDYPAAGLNASATDVAKLFGALHGDHLLQPSTMEQLWTPPVLASGKAASYGLGWVVSDVLGQKAVGHEGGGSSFVTHIPSRRLSTIALTNLAGSGANLSVELASTLIT